MKKEHQNIHQGRSPSGAQRKSFFTPSHYNAQEHTAEGHSSERASFNHATPQVSAAPAQFLQRMQALTQVAPLEERRHHGVNGYNTEALTDSHSTVDVWTPERVQQGANEYWCHGHSLETYHDFGYSVYSGDPLRQVLADEYQEILPSQVRTGDIIVWEPSFGHSAIVQRPAFSRGILDPTRTLLSTKNGFTPLATEALAEVSRKYEDLHSTPIFYANN